MFSKLDFLAESEKLYDKLNKFKEGINQGLQ